ncbi:MAG TPA: hypothetical protein VGQ81_05055 [Acidobacteriota bacterium]|jgi:hypothetical protein|nr:hypothetical protein [Acidobacteriota bacterium]
MKQLTLRGFDKDVEREIRNVARRRGISLNRAAVELLRKGAGLAEPGARSDIVGDSLDTLIGTWSERDEREFLEAVAALEQIDRRFWR